MSETNPGTPRRSPLAGCAIFLAIAGMVVFLIVFSLFTMSRQFSEISKFTAEKPAPVETTAVVGDDAAVRTLTDKLNDFRTRLKTGGTTEIVLTPAELNLAIAAYEPLRDLRGTFRVLDAAGDSLRIAISFPLNGKPRFSRKGDPGWITSDKRYLNGVLVAKPALLKQEIVLRIEKFEPANGAAVPPEFIGQMSPYRITERYTKDRTIGPVMAGLTGAAARDGALVLRRAEGETPADRISDSQVDSASKRFFTWFGIAAVGFLIFAGTVVFMGLRAKTRKSAR